MKENAKEDEEREFLRHGSHESNSPPPFLYILPHKE